MNPPLYSRPDATLPLIWGVALIAASDGEQILAPLQLIGAVWTGNRSGHGLGHAANQILDGKNNLGRGQFMPNRGQSPHVNDDRGQVLVGQVAEVLIRHHGEKRSPVVTDAFPDGARQLVVGPVPGTGFGIWSNVGRHDAPGEIAEPHNLADASAARQDRPSVDIPVVQGMAAGASGRRRKEIAATFQTLRCSFKLPVGCGACSGADEWPPPDGQADRDQQQHNQDGHNPEQNFPKLLH